MLSLVLYLFVLETCVTMLVSCVLLLLLLLVLLGVTNSVAVHAGPVVRKQLHLTKINFEVSRREKTSMFIGREWLFRDMEVVSLSLEPHLYTAHVI